MVQIQLDTSGQSEEWIAFRDRQRHNPFLAVNPLYALDEKLIGCIQKAIPDFFSSEEFQFERDLAASASFCFSDGRAFGHSESDKAAMTARHANTADTIRQLQLQEGATRGIEAKAMEKTFAMQDTHRKKTLSKKAGFAGWLLVNPVFREELRSLQTEWSSAVEQSHGRFPRMPLWVLSASQSPDHWPPDFYDDCMEFFGRWCLETLTTWDWPEPMEPDFGAGLRRD